MNATNRTRIACTSSSNTHPATPSMSPAGPKAMLFSPAASPIPPAIFGAVAPPLAPRRITHPLRRHERRQRPAIREPGPRSGADLLRVLSVRVSGRLLVKITGG
jgi:hypothetical protein